MRTSIVVFGLVLILIALISSIIFPTYIYQPAKNVVSDEYKDGDSLTVYGTITQITYVNNLNITVIVLDGHLKVFAYNKITGYTPGEEVYMKIKKVSAVSIGSFELSYWLTEEKEIHSVNIWKNIFLYTQISGLVISFLGLAAKR